MYSVASSSCKELRESRGVVTTEKEGVRESRREWWKSERERKKEDNNRG
jgi:hypothetical protein